MEALLERERREAHDREERLRNRIAQQWAEGRAARGHGPVTIEGGASTYKKVQVPYGVDLAAAWAWRFVIIAIALLMILLALRHFEFVVFPVLIALFLTALGNPVVGWLDRLGLPRKVGALLVVVLGLATIGLLLTFVGTQVSSGIDDLSGQVVDGLEEIRHWLQTGPLHVTDSQIDNMISESQKFVTDQGKDLASRVTTIGSAVGEIVAGIFLVLFSTYFFLADGERIWAWVVRLFPRTARLRADSSGRVAFKSLTQFVRATVIVAATDAVGVMIWAAVLGLPFISAIGVLVFLGAFVPMVGATVSGFVAILVALVAKGPITALLMLAGVVVVQQIEAHLLQPFLMGRWVSVHPLGVIIAIAMGIVLAGIPGALIAVPLASSVNAVANHLAGFEEPEPDGGPDPGSDDESPPDQDLDDVSEEAIAEAAEDQSED
jgi:predicted PurR-regulated permease PerM